VCKLREWLNQNGCWRLNYDNQWDFDSWTGYMESSIKDRTEEKQYIYNVGFNEEDFNFIMKCHDLFMNNYQCQQRSAMSW
jgi:hypothetical protein